MPIRSSRHCSSPLPVFLPLPSDVSSFLKAFETFYCAIVTITSIQRRYAGNSFCIGKENLSVSADGPLIFKMITNFCIIMYCVSVPSLPITLIYCNSGKFISQNVKLIRLGSNVPFIFCLFITDKTPIVAPRTRNSWWHRKAL